MIQMLRIKSDITYPDSATLVLLICLFLIGNYTLAQNQRADYKINCILNDNLHTLTANMEITYHNRSGKTLSALKLHTWMNTFKANKSEYSRQLARMGDSRKYKLSKSDQGGYVRLEFSIRNEIVKFSYENKSQEIIQVELNEPLRHGDSVKLSCDYILDIPKNISRGGHLRNSYQMTQWYPKIALLDSTGWNTMNYLEIGEFYNDFGNYEVSISLPTGYTTAATGTLLNKQEKENLVASALRLRDSVKGYSPQEIANKQELKTLHYVANNVVDFAWFADHEFWVGFDTISLPHRTIELWSFYKSNKLSYWKEACSHAKKVIKYISEKIGEYPYPQVSLVACDRPGLDAMEYPMITLVDKGYSSSPVELEKVIVHEIAHNWFQAIVASNERKEAWLDEGLVSYIEKEYFHDRNMPNFFSDAPLPFLTDYEEADDFPWYLQARENNDMAATDPINHFSLMGYIQSIYEKPAKGFKLLNRALGDSMLEKRIRPYYEKWKFSHPKAEDLYRHLGSDSIWFGNLYIKSNTKIDLQLSLKKDFLILSHNQNYSVPIEVEGYLKGKKAWSSIKYVFKKDSVKLNSLLQDYIIGDPHFRLPEIHRANNIVHLRPSPFSPQKTEFHLLPGIGHSMTRDWYIHPLIGFNAHDRFFTGVAVHNFTLPAPSTLAGVILGYSFKTKRPVIQGGISQKLAIKSNLINSITLEFEYRTFSEGDKTANITKQFYHKISPKLSIDLTSNSQLSSEKKISLRSLFISQVKKRTSDQDIVQKYIINEIQYTDENSKHLFPHLWKTALEFNSNYINLRSSFQVDVPYKFGNKAFSEFRFFAGIQHNSDNLFNSQFSLSGTTSGTERSNDYKYDELLLGRTTFDSNLNQQVFLKDAGFYTSSTSGWSDSWLFAATFRSTLFDIKPIRPYLQIAVAPENRSKQASVYFASGFSLVILRKIVELNFPVYETRSIRSGYSDYQRNKYLRTCTFLIDLKSLNPMKWVSKLAK